MIRELEAIAASDVYRREPLLNHDESRIEPVESFVAVFNIRQDLSLQAAKTTAAYICERVSMVAVLHDNDMIDRQRNRDAGPRRSSGFDRTITASTSVKRTYLLRRHRH